MDYTISTVTDSTDRAELDELLHEFYTVVLGKLAAVGGPTTYKPEDVIATFWPSFHKFLPPTGRLLLVRDETGRLVGCATLQQARPDAGELKRLYVRPEANGHGLGRKLVDMRMQVAKDLGWRTLLVDAIKDNQDMLRIYEKLGFRFVDVFPECSDPVDVQPYLVYMQYDFY